MGAARGRSPPAPDQPPLDQRRQQLVGEVGAGGLVGIGALGGWRRPMETSLRRHSGAGVDPHDSDPAWRFRPPSAAFRSRQPVWNVPLAGSVATLAGAICSQVPGVPANGAHELRPLLARQKAPTLHASWVGGSLAVFGLLFWQVPSRTVRDAQGVG